MYNIMDAYKEFCITKIPYFRQYTHDQPLVMKYETYDKTRELGRILNKAIHYLVENYGRFAGKMRLSDRDLQILEICGKYPFRAGTYRTDFIIDIHNQIKIIEATTRQPLNAYLDSVFTGLIGEQLAQELGLTEIKREMERFMDFLQNDFLQKGKVTSIKGDERMVGFKLYSGLFPAAGIEFNAIHYSDLRSKEPLLHDSLVIEELSLDEIRSLPDIMIDELTAAGIFNDFRNLLLVHNKRFFQLLTDIDFLNFALNPGEQQFLGEFTVPTYSKHSHPEMFEKALLDKDGWILKPTSLGKSEGITAGCVTGDDDWKDLFSHDNLQNWVLQPMIEQKKYRGTIGDEIRDDYIAGTLLYFDNHYFGPGMYRASSHVITNVADDRKLAQVVANDIPVNLSGNNIL